MSDDRVLFAQDGPLVQITFHHAATRNALTPGMYSELVAACERVRNDSSVRLVVFRGAGGKAFVSGSDIHMFTRFNSGKDGVAYEARVDEVVQQVEDLPMTTLAVVEGWAVGAGLVLASVCDFRIATPGARFGAPIGRTIGNCLSAASTARLANLFGVHATKRMLLLGEMLTSEEMLTSGALLRIVEPDAIKDAVTAVLESSQSNAPLTTMAVKETIRRLYAPRVPSTDDLIDRVYGSQDFRLGVETFLGGTKQIPSWKGQ